MIQHNFMSAHLLNSCLIKDFDDSYLFFIMLKAEIWYQYRTETVLKFYQYNLEIIALYKS